MIASAVRKQLRPAKAEMRGTNRDVEMESWQKTGLADGAQKTSLGYEVVCKSPYTFREKIVLKNYRKRVNNEGEPTV